MADINVPLMKKDIYDPKNHYWISYDSEHKNKVSFFMGFAFPIYDLNCNENPNMKSQYLGHIDETTFDVFNIACSGTAMMTFYDDANDEIHYRKIHIELLDKTYFDEEKEEIFSLDNILRFKVSCFDDNEIIASDVETISIKNMRLKDKNKIEDGKYKSAIMNNSNSADNRKVEVRNGDNVTVKLLDEGQYNLRIKCFVPGVDSMWLTLYFQAKKVSDYNNEYYNNIAKKIDNSNIPKYITPFVNPYINDNIK